MSEGERERKRDDCISKISKYSFSKTLTLSLCTETIVYIMYKIFFRQQLTMSVGAVGRYTELCSKSYF